MADNKKIDTPMLDELTSGPWPSFINELKKVAPRKPMVQDLLGQLEQSYEDGQGYWKHGGIVGVMGYGGGVIGRYSALSEKFPNCAHFHTIRVNQPAGWFYTSKALRTICDIWEKHGSGLTNMHGSTGDIVLLGTTTNELEPTFAELTQNGFDLGGSGSDLRTPSCCVGQARCEWARYDTMALTYDLTQTFQDEMHRPPFPYKFKIKCAGCPNDCVASIARADLSIIGTWRDDIRIDQEAVQGYLGGEIPPNGGGHMSRDWGKFDIQKEVIGLCPTECMCMEGKKLKIDNKECNRCMHCINVMPRALRIGKDRGLSILVGAKAPILDGAQMGSLLVPFVKAEAPYEEIKEVIEKVWDWWMEEGKNRERLGELIKRQGFRKLLEATGIAPDARHVKEPRSNPYIFWKEEEVEGGWTRDVNEFRKHHLR